MEKINEINIADKNIYKKILTTIKQNYINQNSLIIIGKNLKIYLSKILKQKVFLKLNISLIKWACKKLKIKCNFYNFSYLKQTYQG